MSVVSVEMQRDGSRKHAVKARLLTLNDIDGRTTAARETRDLIAALEADQGGRDQISTARLQLIEAAGLTTAMRKDLGARWLAGEQVDVTVYCTLTNSERRLYETSGLNRVPTDVTSLGEYLAAAIDQGSE
jgi:hypothetical protein